MYPEVPRAVLLSRVCVPGQELCCLPVSVLRQPRELPRALWGEAGGWKEPRWEGQSPVSVERVLHGPGLFTAPHHLQDISDGSFEEEYQSRG